MEPAYPPVSTPSLRARAPPPPKYVSSTVAPNGWPRWSVPNSSSVVRLPTQFAIVCSRCSSDAASSLPSELSARLITACVALVVAFETPPGHATCTMVPGSDSNFTARATPAGTQGMSQHRYVMTQQRTSETVAWIGLLMTAGACGDEPRKSNVSVSSFFVISQTAV